MTTNDPPQIAPEGSPRPQGVASYVLAGVSFIPLIGVPFGIAAIIVGAIQKRFLAVGLGAAGICFTILLYGSLFYFGFVQRGGIYDSLRVSLASTTLKTAVREVEYYKQVHGKYPESLKDLEAQTRNEMPVLIDPTVMQRHPFSASPYFFYQLLPDGKGYYLRSVGPDGLPFTADDIVPDIPEAERQKIGLRVEGPVAHKPPLQTPISGQPAAGTPIPPPSDAADQ